MAILTQGELQLLLGAIEERTGIRHRKDQLEVVGKTIEKVMHDAGIEQTDEFLSALDRDDSVFHQLVEAITIGETYFFREPKQFDFVCEHLIPEFRNGYGNECTLRAWSAACSSGEEAYSLAILCRQMNQPVDILATDIAPESLAQAKQATYRDWSFRGESLDRIRPFLMPGETENQRTLNPSIRRAVRFRLLNLVTGKYPEATLGTMFLNVIFCRNVLIYFDQSTSQQIASRLVECLAPGGWLITASADLSLAKIPGITAVSNDWGTFYRRDKPTDQFFAPLQTEVESPVTASLPELIQSPPLSIEAPSEAPRNNGPDASHPARPSSLYQQLQLLRQQDLPAALIKVRELADSHPLESSLHYHHGRLLMESGRAAEAAKAVQKALFLDQSAIMPHFLFGTIQMNRGQWEAAGRHFRIARQLCEAIRPEDPIPLSDSMTAAETTAAVDSQIAKLISQPD